MKRIQRKTVGMIRGLEYLSSEERMRELGSFSLEKRKFQISLSVLKQGL